MFQMKILADEHYCMFWQCPRNQNIYRYNFLINANVRSTPVTWFILFRREHVFCFKTVLLIIVKKYFKITHTCIYNIWRFFFSKLIKTASHPTKDSNKVHILHSLCWVSRDTLIVGDEFALAIPKIYWLLSGFRKSHVK